MRFSTDDTARILRFRDGDTVICDVTCSHCEMTSRKIVRITGIESWEPSKGTKGIAMATALILNEMFVDKVGVFVAGSGRNDRYGRIIGDILIDGILLSTSIVSNNLAWYGVGAPQPTWFDLETIFKGGFNGDR